MKNKSIFRNRFIHLYNPKEEGLGAYDVNYINAYRKDKNYKKQISKEKNERYAA
tara:strand:+ start:617 stop:778 length:162 start_codon:yes stop_codon:yes gene_type:complete